MLIVLALQNFSFFFFFSWFIFNCIVFICADGKKLLTQLLLGLLQLIRKQVLDWKK